MGPVEVFNMDMEVGEVIKKGEDCVLDVVPEFPKETWAEAIRTWTGIYIHLKEGILDFLREQGRV